MIWLTIALYIIFKVSYIIVKKLKEEERGREKKKRKAKTGGERKRHTDRETE